MKQTCKKCGQIKDIKEYYYDKKRNYYETRCRDCSNKYKKEWSDNNKNKVKRSYRKYVESNKEKLSKIAHKYYINNKTEVLRKNKEYKLQNKERQKKYSKEYYIKNKESINRKQNHKRKDPEYLKKERIRHNKYMKYKYATDKAVKNRTKYRARLSSVLLDKYSDKVSIQYFGCNIYTLKKYLESQFKDKMNWKNRGLKGWHVDHIKPCNDFDLTKERELKKCFHYLNLQPLWASENRSKGIKCGN